MYTIIVGAGRVGMYIAKNLGKNNEVVLIEQDKEKAQEAIKTLDALVINGDGTDMETLTEAGVDKADVLIGATGKDEVNLLACLIAKNRGAKKTIARVGKIEYIEVFKSLGVDHVISPEISGAEKICKLVLHPKAVDLTIIEREDIEILEFNISNDSIVKDKKVKEIPAEDFLIIAIKRNNKVVLPNPEIEIKEGDKVWVIAKSAAVDGVSKFFVK